MKPLLSQDGKEESGWKLISGDVFRSPPAPADLSVQFGSGVQIFCTGVVTLLLAAAGFLSPASRGALLTSAIVLYLLLAICAGYSAVALWSNMQRTATGWTSVCLKTACYFPGAHNPPPAASCMYACANSSGTSRSSAFQSHAACI
jgi:transmembrane 9 superfamily member 2/4